MAQITVHSPGWEVRATARGAVAPMAPSLPGLPEEFLTAGSSVEEVVLQPRPVGRGAVAASVDRSELRPRRRRGRGARCPASVRCADVSSAGRNSPAHARRAGHRPASPCPRRRRPRTGVARHLDAGDQGDRRQGQRRGHRCRGRRDAADSDAGVRDAAPGSGKGSRKAG